MPAGSELKARLRRGDNDTPARLLVDPARFGVDAATVLALQDLALEVARPEEATALLESLLTLRTRGDTVSPGKLPRSLERRAMPSVPLRGKAPAPARWPRQAEPRRDPGEVDRDPVLFESQPAGDTNVLFAPTDFEPIGPAEPAAPALDPLEARARAAIDAALGRVGIAVPEAQRGLLATYYGEGMALTSWALGAGDARARGLVDRMLAHCDHHHGCGHRPAAPPVVAAEPTGDQALDPETRRAIEHTTGRSLGDVAVRRDAAVAARGRLGEAVGNVIKLAPQVPGPDTELGREVLLHEAAHVAQQSAPAERAPVGGDPVGAVEADAHAVADAAARGERREPGVRAESGQAYGLDAGDVVNAAGNLVGAAADALGVDPMAWMRQFAPGLAGFVDNGFEPMVRQLGDAASRAVQPILAAVNPQQLAQQFTDWVSKMQTESLGFGVLTGCCECLQGALGSALEAVKGALGSPLAEQIRQFLTSAQKDGNSWLIDQIKSVTDDVTSVIDGVLSLYESARALLGPAIQEVWTYIADALGLDKSLSPAAAIRKKLSELWDALLEELEPVRRALEDAWQFLCDETFIGDIVAFIGDCQKLMRAIQLCRDSQSRDPQVWLGILAREMKGTVFEGLIADLQSGVTTAIAVGQAVSRWAVRLLQKLGVIKAWNSAAPALAALGRAIKAFAARVEAVINEVKRVIEAAMKAVADAFRKIYEAIRPLLNFVVGFGVALMALATGNPLPMIMFFAGNLWLYVVPDCYKEALADFVLQLFITVVEWMPAEFPLVVFMRSAALGFLRTLLGASAQEKITAMDMVARAWAGDFELMLGFVVGFFKGLWNSTPGLLIQLTLFSFTMPFRAMWSAAETLASFAGRGGAELANMGEWVVDLMSRAQTVEADAEGNVEQGPFAEEESAEPAPTSDETEIGPPEVLEGPPEEDEDATGVSSPDPDGDGPAPGENDEEQGDDADPGEIDDPVWEPLPPLEDLGSVVETLDSLRNGISRESIEKFLGQFNASLAEMGTTAGTSAGEAFVAAMTARGTPYRIGEIVGQVVGFITGEVLIQFIPVGGQIGSAVAKIPQIGRVVMTALKSFPMFVRGLEMLRAMIAPAMRMLAQFGDELARVGRAIAKWFDDLVKWARTQLDNFLAWVGRNFPRLRRLLRRGLRRLLGGDDLDDVAEEAAEDAWGMLVRQLGDAVYTQAEIQQRLNGIRVSHPADTRVRLRMIAHRSSWEIRATATKGGSSKSADAGRGWVVSSHGSRTPYYAPESDWWNHHRVLDRAADDIMDWEPSDPSAEFSQRYRELRTKVETEQREGQARLRMRGIEFRFEMEEQSSVERDDTCTITLILTPNARTRKVYKPAPHKTEHLGARRTGSTFEGDFGHADWTWTGYDGGAITRHPVNSWNTYSNDLTVMTRPTGHYRHGGRTRGWSARSWRRHIDRRVDDKVDGGMTEAAAQQEVMDEEQARTGITVANWDTMYLRGWEGHHIHEVSWAGPHSVGNIVYLESGEHNHYSQWWQRRAEEIKDELGIERW